MYTSRCVLALVALCVGLSHSSAQTSIHIKDIDDLNNRLAVAGEKLVVINFMTTWCRHSKGIAPTLEEMATEMADAIVVLKVDIDKLRHIAKEYNVKSVPTFVFVKSGKKLDEIVGANVDTLRTTTNRLK